MKPFRGVGWGCALWLLCASANPAHAAWCNVFQVCCASCGGQPAVSNYAPADPCCNPCPQPCCTTQYVQRCYYEPVTCYQTRTYYEPVTTYRTSFYYEPVTSFRYSCYCDPCTGCCQQVACPQTCYRLRSQCCPVQSWVQRCCQVPVTTYRQCSYWEPVTTCCAPPAPCCPTSYSAPAPAAPCDSGTPPAAAPAVTEQRAAPAPAVREQPGQAPASSGSPLYDRYYPPSQSAPPPAAGSSLKPIPAVPAPANPTGGPPRVKLESVVALPTPNLAGKVVHGDNAPDAWTRLVFVSADARGQQQDATADAAGRFGVTLASGGWLVYLRGADNRPVFHSKIDVHDNEPQQLTLVSR